MVQFKNPDTAARFECLFTTDNKIHLPTINFSGKISSLTPEAAEELVKQKHTKIKEKAEAPAKSTVTPPAGSAKPEAGKKDSKPEEK